MRAEGSEPHLVHTFSLRASVGGVAMALRRGGGGAPVAGEIHADDATGGLERSAHVSEVEDGSTWQQGQYQKD